LNKYRTTILQLQNKNRTYNDAYCCCRFLRKTV